MRKLKAFWACSLVLPATVVPLTTATSCSQTWGYKTPLSIGTNLKGTTLDPYYNFAGNTDLVDLNGDSIVSTLQSNYAVDVAHSGYYGYSLPQKWDSTKGSETETLTTGESIKWNNKGEFVDSSAKWRQYSDSDFVTSTTKNGTKTCSDQSKINVSETISSYKNNIQASNIELVTLIGTSMNQFFNYVLQYQGSQIGTEYASSTETDTDLAYAWGQNLTHGTDSSAENRKFFESIFAANAVSGTSKTQALLRPSHIEFQFVDMPIPAYTMESNVITGVSETTKKLLSHQNLRPGSTGASSTAPAYWSSKSDEYTETTYNFRTGTKAGTKEECKYITYNFKNVPVIVKFNEFAKTYVNPTINSGFMVSDFYSSGDTIKNTIGNSWTDSLPKFDKTPGAEYKPQYCSFQFYSPSGTKAELDPKSTDPYYRDGRIWTLDLSECRLQQNDFVVLLNYSYKECTSIKIDDGEEVKTESELAKRDRVTMTGFNTLFPAFLCDTSIVPDTENTLFVKANTDSSLKKTFGFIFDTNKVNTYVNNFIQLVNRSSSEGRKAHAKDLSADSKKLLKFLAYMLGSDSFAVNTADCLKTTDIA